MAPKPGATTPGSVPALGVNEDVLNVDQVGLEGEADQLDAVSNLGLGDEVAHVGLDCGHGQPQVLADLLIGETLRDKSEHLGFTICQ